MAEAVSASLRREVYAHANGRCEYCHLPETYTLRKHEPDHIIPVQHGGVTESQNLALACFSCNRHKGPNVGSFDSESGELTPFFHPRNDDWNNHFAWDGATIVAKSATARVTIQILKMNAPQRLIERKKLFKLGVYKN